MIRFEPVCVAGVRETVHNDLRLTGVEGLAHPVAELVVGDGAPEPAMDRICYGMVQSDWILCIRNEAVHK